MMTREQMMDNVIRQRGFEDKYTVWFCTLCEDKNMSDEALMSTMIATETVGFEEEEEE